MPTATLQSYHVDAFTSSPFGGNPAVVLLLQSPTTDAWMQKFAAEMNLSETAFLLPAEASDGFDYHLRWFTPMAEVDLCGHATLASAHILYTTQNYSDGRVLRFSTRSGILTAAQTDDGIELDFPAKREEACPLPSEIEDSLGVFPVYVGRNAFDYLIEIESEILLRGLVPNLQLLKDADCRGLIVTARASNPNYDFVSRFFAPAVGVDEDPVTGSAHCCLAPYWQQRIGKTTMIGYQASKRGGLVKVINVGDRVKLIGQAVTILESSVRISTQTV